MPTKGAAASIAAITAMPSMIPDWRRGAGITAATGSVIASPLLAEQSRGLDQEDDHHDHEDDRVRCFGIKHLGQALDDTQTEAGQNGAEYRAHSADHHYCEDDDDQVRAHQR